MAIPRADWSLEMSKCCSVLGRSAGVVSSEMSELVDQFEIKKSVDAGRASDNYWIIKKESYKF